MNGAKIFCLQYTNNIIVISFLNNYKLTCYLFNPDLSYIIGYYLGTIILPSNFYKHIYLKDDLSIICYIQKLFTSINTIFFLIVEINEIEEIDLENFEIEISDNEGNHYYTADALLLTENRLVLLTIHDSYRMISIYITDFWLYQTFCLL